MPREVTVAELFSDMRADYDFAKSDVVRRKRTGLPALGAGADFHFRTESQQLQFMELARDVDRNDLVVGQALDRLVNNVIQGGFPLDPQTGDDEADEILQESWEEWSGDKRLCDFTQTSNWHEKRQFALRSMIVDGDIFKIFTDRGSVETVEAHRSRTPSGTRRNVVFGILKDADNIPRQVWFTKEDIHPLQRVHLVNQTTPYDFYDGNGNPQVLHLLRRRRPSFTRGITTFAPIFTAAGLHDDIQFAELVKQQVQSCIAFLRERPLANADDLISPGSGTAGEVELRHSEQSVRLLQHIFPGMEITGKPGETLQAFSPNAGGTNFISHSHLILTFIAINLDLPVHVLLLDPSQTNFSGWRGAIDQARIKWRELQKWLIDSLDTPTYLWKVREWAAERSKRGQRLRAAIQRGAILTRHVFHPPGFAYIEPLKDTQADSLEVKSNLNSPRRVLARKQLDWFRVSRETVEDNAYLIRLAKKEAAAINAEFPNDQPVHWQQLIGLALPQGVSMRIQETTEQEPKSDPAKKSEAA
ncbi:phage portal protein [Schlesneria sp.]|uniref:phage portal protein n=1 Tax=Schlesneria sp. TaxID=2762018 RepID=UPI002F1806C3